MKSSILVVEDQREEYPMIRAALSELGYELEFANTKDNAINKIAYKSYQALVVDLDLHGEPLAGVEVIEYCQSIRPFSKSIVLTGRNVFKGEESSRVIRCLEAGAFRWVYKDIPGEPYINKLQKAVKEAVSHYIVDDGGVRLLTELYSKRLGCPIHPDDGGKCAIPNVIIGANDEGQGYSEKKGFLAIPYENYSNREEAIYEVMKAAELEPIIAKKQPDYGVKICNFCCSIRKCKYVIADVSRPNSVNIMYELGLSHALGKKVALLYNNDDDVEGWIKKTGEMAWDISVFIPIDYSPTDGNEIKRLKVKLADWLLKHAKYDINISQLASYKTSKMEAP